MTLDQLAEAQRLAREWKADLGEVREVRELEKKGLLPKGK